MAQVDAQPGQGGPHLGVVGSRVQAAAVGVRTRRGTVLRRHGVQLPQGPAEVGTQPRPVDVGGAGQDGARQPAPHGPGVRVPGPGAAEGHDLGDGDREVPGEQRQGVGLLRHGVGVPGAGRQPDREVVTEPERAVVVALRLDRRDGAVRPLRELLGDQRVDRGRVHQLSCSHSVR